MKTELWRSRGSEEGNVMVSRNPKLKTLLAEEEASSGGLVAEPIEEHMSRAEWLADEEVAVPFVTVDPHDKNRGSSSESIHMIDEDTVRSEDPADLKRLWSEWVAKMGTEEASRRWLAIFAATDASPTG